jgi:hypothetical protein
VNLKAKEKKGVHTSHLVYFGLARVVFLLLIWLKHRGGILVILYLHQVMSNSPLQLSPTQWARVVTCHQPLCNAAPVELVAAGGHHAAPVAVLELSQADHAPH